MAKKKTIRPPAKRTSAKAKIRAKKTARSTGPWPQLLKPVKEPDDNPRLRYQELMADRHFGTPSGVNLAKLRVAASADTTDMVPRREAPVTPATPGGNNWVQLGPLAVSNGQTYGGTARVMVTGRVTGIAPHPTDPDTIYVATARGGIWKTTDGGVSWQAKSDHAASLAIGALAMSASDPNTLYAGTGEGNIYYYAITFPLNSVNASYNGSGILKSTDGGATWTTEGAATFLGNCFYRLAVHPAIPDTAFAASNLGLYRTTDGGATWDHMTNGLPPIGAPILAATDVVFDPATPTTAYVAFWGDGIYKTTNAAAARPSWTKLTGGLPTTDLSRIAIALSPTSPENIYALIANANDALNGVFASADGGTKWTKVPAAAVSVYGAYTLNIAVDISTPDIVYLSGVSLYKAVRTAGAWSVTEIGANLHADNHSFAGHPTDHQIIYAGSDGGIYKSSDGGNTWDDTINEGLCITQFEFIDQHPTSDAEVIGGTQDNGTVIFRNSPAFYHSADGDGGAAGIDHADPRNVIHTYYNPTPERSTQGGKFGTYASISAGIAGNSLFYPPWAYDQTNSQNIAFGTERINLDAAQGAGKWPIKVMLPGITGGVSAISYVNTNLIYACTSSGQVYRLARNAGKWAASAIHAAPLPKRWIWAIATLPADVNTVVLVMAGFGTSHVWRGTVAASGTAATWTDINGTGANHVPDIPVNALCIDPLNADSFYVGTDIGIFRTTDAGVNWTLYSDGLPNTAVYDLLLHGTARLLRAATHGRGLWERELDTPARPNVDIYIRDHLMDTARAQPTVAPVTAAFEDPLQQVALGDPLWWWMCADIKVDAPSPLTHAYQMAVPAVDYLAFETRLAHRNPQRGVINRVYVQIHNRGIQHATNVTVKILYADATPRLPDLPADFWTAFPGDGNTTVWKPIGAAQTIASLSPTRPEMLEWDWVPPVTAAQHSCLLVVSECASDAIPAAHKVFNVGALVTGEKRAGLKNLHIIDAQSPVWTHLKITASAKTDVIRLSGVPAGWSMGILMPTAISSGVKTQGLTAAKLTKQQTDALKQDLQANFALYNPAQLQVLASGAKPATVTAFPNTKPFDLLLLFTRKANAQSGSVTVIQESGGKSIGGNTFALT